jgi:hypothetical protein
MALLLQLTQKPAHGFSALWARYPNKNAKKDAQKAYGQVVTTPAIDEEVNAALDWQIPHWQTLDWYHPPYLATYLRKERFRDEPPKTPTRNLAIVKGTTPEQTQAQDAVTRIAFLISRGMDREEAKRTVYLEMKWIKE